MNVAAFVENKNALALTARIWLGDIDGSVFALIFKQEACITIVQ